MFAHNRLLPIGIVFLTLLSASNLYGENAVPVGIENVQRQTRLSIEYYFPTEEDRDIRTVNVNAYFRIDQHKIKTLSLYAGLTATCGYGDIIQLEGDLDQGTLREVNYENRAFGIGPGVMADLSLISMGNLSLYVDASGSLVFYNRDFPAGGKRYNFMWRGGPAVQLGRHVGIAYRWMHVSNGQGLGPQNPSYDAQGVSLYYFLAF